MLFDARTVSVLAVPEFVIAAAIVASPAEAAIVRLSAAVIAPVFEKVTPPKVVVPLKVFAPVTSSAPALETMLAGELIVLLPWSRMR